MAITAEAGMAHALLERLEAEGKLDEALRYEILNGELVIGGAPRVRHQEAVHVLLEHFRPWVRRHGGAAFTGMGIEIGGQQLIPDLFFIGPDRAGELDADGCRVPPDLVAEVTSPGTRSVDLHEKRDIYARIGVGEYWVVDLTREVVLVHRRDEAGAFAVTEHTDGTLSTPAAPGLAVPVDEVLAAG
jgi:Uma2 family endonuclease